ncbi:MAG: DUF6514 family protein [Clostridiales bacterium]|nr:DUF6514 family protein [Clostridiales bacterium]
MDKRVISEKNISLGNDEKLQLQYSLLSSLSECSVSDRHTNRCVYGISIDQLSYCNEISEESAINFDCVTGITYEESEALNLINALAKNTVTPLSLVYIVDDYIGGKEMMGFNCKSSGANCVK